jgi:hypothetical protein
MSAASDVVLRPPLWRRVWRWLFAVEPMDHAWWETLVMRAIIAYAAWTSLAIPSPFISQPHPHGLAAWGVDFSWLGNESLAPVLRVVLPLCLLLYVFRVLPVLALLPVLICSIGHGVLGNSQGAIGHTTQILTVALLAQWLAHAWAAVQPRTRWPMPHGFNAPQLAADWSRQVVAATYVVSAISKLVDSAGDWVSDTPYFGLQVVKSNGMGFYDHLVPRTDGFGAWLGQWFVDHPHVATIILGAALPLELFAFLALNNRRIALIFGVALFAFHSSITEVMQLGFLYHKLLLLALFINLPWWLVKLVRCARFSAFRSGETR